MHNCHLQLKCGAHKRPLSPILVQALQKPIFLDSPRHTRSKLLTPVGRTPDHPSNRSTKFPAFNTALHHAMAATSLDIPRTRSTSLNPAGWGVYGCTFSNIETLQTMEYVYP